MMALIRKHYIEPATHKLDDTRINSLTPDTPRVEDGIRDVSTADAVDTSERCTSSTCYVVI